MGLGERSVRVLLHRLWGRERVNYRSWAIQSTPDAIEREAWRQRGIDVFDLDPEEFAQRLSTRLTEEPVTWTG